MWCGRKGIDCPDCGMFGECFRTAWCGLPDRYPTTAGTSSGSYSYKHWNSTNNPTVYMPNEIQINGIKYRKVEE